jgi:hypothetical protein
MKLHQMKRRIHNENESVRNHLLSIQLNAEWVTQTKEMFPRFALIANLRNGAWYAESWDSICYFKSGDGHDNEWQFSIPRLNLHVAQLAAKSHGCIIVDSTRRGKTFPDSLSATIPIWIAVINLIIFQEKSPPFIAPPWMSPGIVDSLISLIPTIVRELPDSCRSFILKTLSHRLSVPLKVFWVAPNEGMLQWDGDGVEDLFEGEVLEQEKEKNCIPVVLLSCSDDISEAEHNSVHSWYYVKGAGDDEENWAHGLTPELFWKHHQEILGSDDQTEVERILLKLITKQREIYFDEFPSDFVVRKAPDHCLDRCFISFYSLNQCLFSLDQMRKGVNSQDEPLRPGHGCTHGVILLFNEEEYQRYLLSSIAQPSNGVVRLLPICFKSGKKNQFKSDFSQQLFYEVLTFYHSLLRSASLSIPTLWIARNECHTSGIDVAVVMCLLLAFYDFNFDLLPLYSSPTLLSIAPDSMEISKVDIQVMAGCLQSALPRFILSRGFLKELQNFFVLPQSLWHQWRDRRRT